MVNYLPGMDGIKYFFDYANDSPILNRWIQMMMLKDQFRHL